MGAVFGWGQGGVSEKGPQSRVRGSPANACSRGLFLEAARRRDQKAWVCLQDLKKAGWLEGSEGLPMQWARSIEACEGSHEGLEQGCDGFRRLLCEDGVMRGGWGTHQGASPKFHPAQNPGCM